MAIPSLPEELLDHSILYVDRASLHTIRLSCRELHLIGTKYLYSHIRIIPDQSGATKVKNILEKPHLANLVTCITLDLAGVLKDDVEWDTLDEEGDYEEEQIASNEIDDFRFIKWFEDKLLCFNRFPNLQSLRLGFDSWVKENNPGAGAEPEQTVEFRELILQYIFGAIGHATSPCRKLHALSIRNLQHMPFANATDTDQFRAILSRLDTLDLQIATEGVEEVGSYTLPIAEAHYFFNTQLNMIWLEPVQANLVQLKLYSSTQSDIHGGRSYWGYFPSCDLRTSHFPKLKSLALGNYTFTHDWQLDWICSHGKTLESLSLDSCPIVHAADLCMPVPPGGRPPTYTEYQNRVDNRKNSTWFYEARWHDYFRRIQQGLPKLTHLAIGSQDCENGAAFENSHMLKAHLSVTRYVIYHGDNAPHPWIEPVPGCGSTKGD